MTSGEGAGEREGLENRERAGARESEKGPVGPRFTPVDTKNIVNSCRRRRHLRRGRRRRRRDYSCTCRVC